MGKRNPYLLRDSGGRPALLTSGSLAESDVAARRLPGTNASAGRLAALNPRIGYDAAASIAKRAQADGLTLRDAAVASGLVTPDQFDAWVVPLEMTRPASG